MGDSNSSPQHYSLEKLFESIRTGKITDFEVFMRLNIPLDVQNHTGRTPFLEALAHKNFAFASSALQQGTDVNVKDAAGLTAAQLIVSFDLEELRFVKGSRESYQYTHMLPKILGKTKDIYQKDLLGHSLMDKAIAKKNFVAIRALIVHGFKPEKHHLLAVFKSGYRNVIEEILNSKVDLNIQDENGRNPLMICLYQKDFVSAQKLVRLGVSTVQKDRLGVSPLHLVAGLHYQPHEKIVAMQFLNGLRLGIKDLLEKDSFGKTLLEKCLNNKNYALAEILLQKQDMLAIPLVKKEILAMHVHDLVKQPESTENLSLLRRILQQNSDLSNETSITLLKDALEKKNYTMASEIIGLGFDKSPVDSYGDSLLLKTLLLHVSSSMQKEDIYKFVSLIEDLQQEGFDIYQKNHRGHSLLTRAVTYKQWDLTEHLLDLGFPMDEKIFGQSLGQIAFSHGATEVLRKLLEEQFHDSNRMHRYFKQKPPFLGYPSHSKKAERDALFFALSGIHEKLSPQDAPKSAMHFLMTGEYDFDHISSTSHKCIDMMLELLYHGADVDHLGENGRTPLLEALHHKNYQIADFLLDMGASYHQQDEKGLNPLQVLCSTDPDQPILKKEHAQEYRYIDEKMGAHDLVLKLLQQGAEIHVQTAEGKNLLDLALEGKNPNFKLMELLILRGLYPSKEQVQKLFDKALHHSDILSAAHMIMLGADVNHSDAFGRTPLMHAIDKGNFKLAMFLINMNANLEVKDIFGTDALGVLAFNRAKIRSPHVQTLFMELSDGIDMRQRDKTEPNLLSLAQESGNDAMFYTLLQNGADYQKLKFPKHSSLWGFLASKEHKETFLNEIRLKASKHILEDQFAFCGELLDAAGRNPLIYAAAVGSKEEVKHLLASGLSINFTDKTNRSPLSYAAQTGNIEVLTELIAIGADPKIKDMHNLSPLDYAVQSKNLTAIHLLWTAFPNMEIQRENISKINAAVKMIRATDPAQEKICKELGERILASLKSVLKDSVRKSPQDHTNLKEESHHRPSALKSPQKRQRMPHSAAKNLRTPRSKKPLNSIKAGSPSNLALGMGCLI